ncbi:deoxyguanosinetriphosphate triphosphohydrolase [Desulfonema ishimotonii]|uniref:Deoxyguanosinetriphosphate triphosphohydrolase n=1 Tax=Desulfonema ishimotonii TaxID=45657 RepID=A0A401FZF8_9BACT|nr:deoxyguanosinetriphosphate triphosphohydrolase [Desulfonema ishimotonii]GBC62369.1 deoxyguanosinetriphosphate triphosphohydrolase [Desulfonema ishimotonii]
MSIREEFEEREKRFMSPCGCLSAASGGRVRPEPLRSVRTVFQLDRDRILYCNAFRRMKYKTQVFLSPLGDQYRTRLTHTLEVSQIARTIARALYLNEDLAEAIALGHDLGHTPFGHSGETALREIFSDSFAHNEQSLRVVDILENNGKGLNLSCEVRDGILKHAKGYGKIVPDNENEKPCTVEGQVVRFADIMAYLNHDLEDAIRSRVIREDEVPAFCSETLGETHPDRATTMMRDIIFSSRTEDGELILSMSEAVHSAMSTLRQFLYENVYRSHKVHKEFIKAKKILSELYQHFTDHSSQLEQELINLEMGHLMHNGQSYERVVCDFIASMTDRYAMNLYARLFFPSPVV